MINGRASRAEMGRVLFEVGKPRPVLSSDEWAEIAVSRILMISDSAPEPIRLQAYGFREQIRLAIAATIRQAIETDRAAAASKLIRDI